MNEMLMAWIRPAALIIVLSVASYLEIAGIKASEFYIGLTTTVVIWFFRSRDDEKRKEEGK